MAASIYFVVEDSDGDKSTVEFFFAEATPLAVLSAGVSAVAALVNPLVLGGLSAAGFRVEVDVSGTWGVVGSVLADIQEKAEFAMRTANGFLSRLNLPTFDESLFVTGQDEVDLADPDVAAFVAFLETGITAGGGTLAPTDYREDQIAFVQTATENWGKRRR